MATVPTKKVSDLKTNPARGGFQSTSVPEGAFDVGASGLLAFGKELSKGADSLGDLALTQMREDNEAEAKELDVGISDTIRKVLYGDPTQVDPSGNPLAPGYISTQRKNALDGWAAAEEAIEAAVAGAIGKASNKSVKEMISKTAANRRQQALEQMVVHANTQRMKFHDELGEAREAQAASDAALQWNNDTEMDRSLGVVAEETRSWGARNGATEEQVVQRTMQRAGVVVKGAFDAASAEGDIVRAHKIFSKYGVGIDGATRAEMAKTLRADTLKARAQLLADEAADPQVSGCRPGDIACQRDYIRRVSSGEEESLSITEFNNRISEAQSDYRFRVAQRVEAEHQEDRGREERAQKVVGEAQNLYKGDPEKMRSYINSKLKGKDQNAANDLLSFRLSAAEGDLQRSEAQTRRELEAFAQQGADAAQDFFPDDVAAQRRYARETIPPGKKQEAAINEINRREAEKRGDQAAEDANQRRNLSETAGKAVDDIWNNTNPDIASRVRQDPAFGRELIRDVLPAGEERDAAIQEHNRRVEEIRADERWGFMLDSRARELEAEARAIANHNYTVKERERLENLRAASRSAYNFLYDETNTTTPRTVAEFRKMHKAEYELLAADGKVEALVTTQRKIQEGHIFANSTDGITLTKLKNLSPAARERIDPNEFRQKLTQQEYGELVNNIEKAKKTMQNLRSGASWLGDIRSAVDTFAPEKFGKSIRDKKRNNSEQQIVEEAITQLTEEVTAYIDTYGKTPDAEAMQRLAAAKMMQVYADPEGIWGGNTSFSGLGAEYKKMSPAQRANAIVEVDNIKASIRAKIDRDLKEHGVEAGEDWMYENLAGAYVTRNTARYNSILEGLRAAGRNK